MANVTRFERLEERQVWTKGGPVVSHLPDDEIAALEEQATATVGDPTTMGLWALATGTWMAGTVIAGIFPAGSAIGAAPTLLVFAGIAQFVAGLFAYRRANSFAANALCCYGALYASVGVTFLLEAAGLLPANGAPSVLLGFLFESFAFISLALTVAALRANVMLVAMFALLCVGYALSGIPQLANSAAAGWGAVGSIGGWFLVASAFCAYYIGMAMVVNSAWKHTALPLGGRA